MHQIWPVFQAAAWKCIFNLMQFEMSILISYSFFEYLGWVSVGQLPDTPIQSLPHSQSSARLGKKNKMTKAYESG